MLIFFFSVSSAPKISYKMKFKLNHWGRFSYSPFVQMNLMNCFVIWFIILQKNVNVALHDYCFVNSKCSKAYVRLTKNQFS